MNNPRRIFQNKLPFMTLNPRANCRKSADKCICLQKNALSYRKMHWPAENIDFGRHMTGNRRTFQESFRAQESRTLANFHKSRIAATLHGHFLNETTLWEITIRKQKKDLMVRISKTIACKSSCCWGLMMIFFYWAVLNGVGVDGVGRIFPFLYFSSIFLCFSSFFFVLLLFQEDKGTTTAIYCKNVEFHSNPRLHQPHAKLFRILGGNICDFLRDLQFFKKKQVVASVGLSCHWEGIFVTWVFGGGSSLASKAFLGGLIIPLISWQRAKRNIANRHLEMPGKIYSSQIWSVQNRLEQIGPPYSPLQLPLFHSPPTSPGSTTPRANCISTGSEML